MLPLGSYGIYLSVNGKDCPKFTFVSIVPPISSSPSLLASTGASLIKILAPSEGETYHPGKLHIYLALHSSVRTFCIQLSHSSAFWCFPSDCEQPLLFENIETNSHILRVWSKDDVTTNDVVVFDVEPLGHAPFVHIVTPTPHQVMHVDSVWLKFQQRPSSLVNGTLLCINIDESKEVCGLDVEQPHQLSNVVEGEHQVCAWILDLDLKDNSGVEESARQESVVCHSFRVVTGVAAGGAGGAGGSGKKQDEVDEVETKIDTTTAATTSSIKTATVLINDGTHGSYTIIVLACSRPQHVKQLWASLLHANYGDHVVRLRIIVDQPSKESNKYLEYQQVVEWAKKDVIQGWFHGPVEIILRPSNYGLKRNMMESWNITDSSSSSSSSSSTKDRLLFLEDDVVVSKFFFEYLLMTELHLGSIVENFSLNSRGIAGISLYRPQWNEISWSSFTPPTDSQNFIQLPCSWGAMYYGDVWISFLQWYKSNQKNLNNSLPQIPRSTTREWNSKTSWKLYMLRYMMEKGLYMSYPNDASYSTTTSPPGTNIQNSKSLTSLFHVILSTSLTDNTTSTTRWFDHEHRCRAGSCAASKSNHVVSKKEALSLHAATRRETSMSCDGDGDAAQCQFNNVGFSAKDNTLLYFRSSHKINDEATPFLPSSYRHRCCLEDLPTFQIQHRPLFLQCAATNTIQTITLMVGGLFPQYGHFLHDVILSLFGAMEALEAGMTNEAKTLEIQNIRSKRNVQIILTNQNMTSADLAAHPLLDLLHQVVSRHQVWLLKDFVRKRRISTFCFQTLIFGTSLNTNLYKLVNPTAVRKFSQQVHMNYGSTLGTANQAKPATRPRLHLVQRRTSRKIINFNQVLLKSKQFFERVTVGDFQSPTFAQQYKEFQDIDTLCAVHGTALLNALFLPRRAVVIHLMPWGTHKWMGKNTRQAARIYKERTLLVITNDNPKSSLYTASVEENGIQLVGSKLADMQHQLSLHPDVLWEGSWMNGFSFFLNVAGVEIDLIKLEVALRAASRKFQPKVSTRDIDKTGNVSINY